VIIPVILSGGAGTRLWPLSRELYPKQLLPLVGELTLLQETICRLDGIADLGAPVVVCNESHRFMVAEQLRAVDTTPGAILLEPVGRNTAPALAVAAMQALLTGDDSLLLVLPADHVIGDEVALCTAVANAALEARRGRLVTFGIVPTAPETGYGYIRAGEPLNPDAGAAFEVAAFVEKPDLATARSYVDSGEYYWNSGMFLFSAAEYLRQLEQFAPQMVQLCRAALDDATVDLDFIRLAAAPFAACPADSIDYALMEKTTMGAVIPLAAGWNDVGSWSALWDIGAKDEQGNVVRGDVLTTGVENCYLHASTRMIAAVGLTDHVVIETADAVLVAARDKVQDVKAIVNQLKEKNRAEVLLHRRVNRPWGSYECIGSAPRYQVKKIVVNPGATLSLQLHHHRAEHWIVVSGTARVVKGDESFILSENQSTYIPLGIVHRLENPGKIALELIEVQSGSYLGEDDIERLEDTYGRS
jgi:mannose-1-phosphate guanylyltransferase/mannose-6-phosphate isomerase